MRTLVDEALAPHRSLLGEVVGTVTSPLHRYAMLSAPMDDVLLNTVISYRSMILQDGEKVR